MILVEIIGKGQTKTLATDVTIEDLGLNEIDAYCNFFFKGIEYLVTGIKIADTVYVYVVPC